jgi:hydroxymethylpyrimidine/phosphomethylpyrimidine kinase
MDRGDASGVTAKVPIALTVAGSDSGGGAGVQADLKTFAAIGVHGACAITALTAQNTLGVRAVHYAPPEIVAAQITAVLDDFSVAAIKIGMLGTAEIAGAVAEALGEPPSPLGREGVVRTATDERSAAQVACSSFRTRPRPLTPNPSPIARRRTGVLPNALWGERRRPFLVYDPVMAASSGDPLSGDGFIEAVKREILPRVDCLTPNLPEAAILIGESIARDEADMASQGRALLKLGPRAVLMKGGHLASEEAVDLLVTPGRVHRFAARWLPSRNLHGTGCTLSSAIAAYVVLGTSLPEAVVAAKAFVRVAIEAGRDVALGDGAGPLVQGEFRGRR